MGIVDKFKELANKANEQGISIPLVRINGVPTFTGTMTLLSFMTALLGQLGKMSKILGPVDLASANYLFMISLGAYLGRRLQTNGKEVTIEKEEK